MIPGDKEMPFLFALISVIWFTYNKHTRFIYINLSIYLYIYMDKVIDQTKMAKEK